MDPIGSSAIRIRFPPELPITAHLDEIGEALARSRVVVVAGETGSGKTTQLPKLCLARGRGLGGMIGHTQPRRLAARSVARRIASEMHVELGREVGYAVRFEDRTSADATRVKVMTDGLLLAETRRDPGLSAYDTLIVDEAHERSLNIDFLLGYLRRLLERRDDLEVLITSATIDVEAFSRHFFDAPVVEVSGRGYPVDVVYREDVAEEAVEAAILDCLDHIETRPSTSARDVLVFLSGEREIFEITRFLKRELGGRYDVLPLYARLSSRDQQRVFEPGGQRRVVLATNVAETSITVPNIGYVIDPGYARISRYSYRSKLQRLPVEPVSRASANQRLGRSGRVAPGVCYRLYGEADFENRPAFTDPEIRRTNLASVVLKMHDLALGEIGRFPFLDPPEARAVNDAVRLLEELGALSGGRLTDTGRKLARLPVDPRLARMLVEADLTGALTEVLIVVSGLAVQDPRERPLAARAAADERHRELADERSDFLGLVKLWQWFEETRARETRAGLRRRCQERFLSYPRLREWRELHRQLRLICRELELRFNTTAADYAQVHAAILTGCLSQIGLEDERGEYLGARNLKFRIFPGSALSKRRPKWLVAAEITETRRVYARSVAGVDPRWIERAAGHLVKRQFSEPHWSAKRGEVVAYERVLLYGLTLVERRTVAYKRHDPSLCRVLFLRDGLVAGRVRSRGRFLEHNLALIDDVRDREARQRRRDLLLGEEALAAFYDQRIPAEVCDLAGFERWRRSAEPTVTDRLFMREQDVLAAADTGAAEQDYPSRLAIEDVTFRLRYRFAPGEADDGVTLEVPLGLLMHVRQEWLDWLVPGLFPARIEGLIRSLPKSIRRQLTPVPDKLETLLPRLMRRYRRGRLLPALAEVIADELGVRVPADAWDPTRLAPHLAMNVKVLADDGRVTDQGRDVNALLARLGQRLEARVAEVGASRFEQSGLTEFPEQGVSETRLLDDGAGQVVTYPTLVDKGDHVDLVLRDKPEGVHAELLEALSRLALLRHKRVVRPLRSEIDGRREVALLFAPLGTRDAFADGVLRAAARYCFFEGRTLPRTRSAFDARMNDSEPTLTRVFRELMEHLGPILEQRFELARTLAESTSPAFAPAVADMMDQLARLVGPSFLDHTPRWALERLPRYLEAMSYRYAHLQGRVDKDRRATEEARAFEARFAALAAQGSSERLEALRYALEEYRVGLFAQSLGTREKVSAKRLNRWLIRLEEQAGLR